MKEREDEAVGEKVIKRRNFIKEERGMRRGRKDNNWGNLVPNQDDVETKMVRPLNCDNLNQNVEMS